MNSVSSRKRHEWSNYSLKESTTMGGSRLYTDSTVIRMKMFAGFGGDMVAKSQVVLQAGGGSDCCCKILYLYNLSVA